MTVVFWTRPVRQRKPGGEWAEAGVRSPTELHVSEDGVRSACGKSVPADATVVAITADWHLHTTCYNCAYRLWPRQAPEGYVRPANGQDFPPRRECPHAPGRGLDPQSCATCTPGLPSLPPVAPSRASVVVGRDPRPSVFRKWHIPSPYDREPCVMCGQEIERGELINIEREAGVMHASCSSHQDA